MKKQNSTPDTGPSKKRRVARDFRPSRIKAKWIVNAVSSPEAEPVRNFEMGAENQEDKGDFKVVDVLFTSFVTENNGRAKLSSLLPSNHPEINLLPELIQCALAAAYLPYANPLRSNRYLPEEFFESLLDCES